MKRISLILLTAVAIASAGLADAAPKKRTRNSDRIGPYGVGTLVILLASHMGATHIPGIGDLQPWQLTLVMMGLPGVLIALLVFTISEPPRTAQKRAGLGGERLLPYMLSDWRPLLPGAPRPRGAGATAASIRP